jgi:Rrf2 family protein
MMLDIATYDKNGPVRIKDIAHRQSISNKYLEQIVSSLQKSGYLKSIRGSQGGYLLTKSPEYYTIGMILRVTEGSLAPISCLEDETNECENQSGCVTLRLWKRLDDAIKNVVDNTTLADMLKWQEEIAPGNYVI